MVEVALALARRRPENTSPLAPELLDLVADRSEEDPIESIGAGAVLSRTSEQIKQRA